MFSLFEVRKKNLEKYIQCVKKKFCDEIIKCKTIYLTRIFDIEALKRSLVFVTL